MEIFIFFLGGIIFLWITSELKNQVREIKRDLETQTNQLNEKINNLEKRLAPSPTSVTYPQAPIVVQPLIAVKDTVMTSVRTQPHAETSANHYTERVKADPIVKKTAEVKLEPGPLNRLFAQIKNYFMTGNTIVKVGVVLIFFGVSFFLKYAIDNDYISIEIRLIATALLGIGILKLGWNLRLKARDYALVLQGGGIGILILTTFVAMKSYGLIPPPFAFVLLVVYTIATAVLAVYQDSLNLAAFGFLGGFLAPILVSTGQGQHVILFSYYTLLNFGIVYVSWKKAWRELNLLGFIFTFGIATLWGVLKYNPEMYWTTQPFLIVFFLIYCLIPLIFAAKKEPELKGLVDGTIVFGNSLLTLYLQLQLVENIPYAGAFSALFLAAFYILLSLYLSKHKSSNYRLLAEAYISIGIVFVTVAIPLAFDGMKTSAIWAVEAGAIYWTGAKQNKKYSRYFALVLIFATSVSFFLGPQKGLSEIIFLNTFFFSCLLLAAGSYIISYFADKYESAFSESEKSVSTLTFVMGTIWWLLGGLYEIDRFTFNLLAGASGQPGGGSIPQYFLLHCQLIYLTIGFSIALISGQKLNWKKLKYLTHAFFIVLIWAYLRSYYRYDHPFAHFGVAAWILAFAVQYWILFQNDKYPEIKNKLFLNASHAVALWVLIGVLVKEMSWAVSLYLGPTSAWQFAAESIMPIAAIWIVTLKTHLIRWPLLKYEDLYMNVVIGPLVFVSWLLLMISNWTNAGNADPLPYIPLLNPLELSHLGFLFVITVWAIKWIKTPNNDTKELKKNMWVVLSATYFIWLNGVLCRGLHHYLGVPFDFSSLFSSVEVQVSLSLFWTLIGISIMTYASKKRIRWIWVTGASFLAVVVLKMFLIDLSKIETMARVISFIGVGILFLVVGYYSPIPAKDIEVHSDAK